MGRSLAARRRSPGAPRAVYASGDSRSRIAARSPLPAASTNAPSVFRPGSSFFPPQPARSTTANRTPRSLFMRGANLAAKKIEQRGRQGLDPLWHEAVEHVVALPPRGHNAIAGKLAQMLRKTRLADPDERRELLGGARPLGDQPERAQPRVVSDRPEHPHELRGRERRARLLRDERRRIGHAERPRRVAVDE